MAHERAGVDQLHLHFHFRFQIAFVVVIIIIHLVDREHEVVRPMVENVAVMKFYTWFLIGLVGRVGISSMAGNKKLLKSAAKVFFVVDHVFRVLAVRGGTYRKLIIVLNSPFPLKPSSASMRCISQ